MPSPTPAEALALLRKTAQTAQNELAPLCDACGAPGGAEGELPDSPTLAGLVADLYEALGEAATYVKPKYPRRVIQDALRATEGALVAWAAQSATEPQRGG